MPDGDKFEWRLYRGLKRAYRLAIGIGDVNEIAQVIHSPINELLRSMCSADTRGKIESAIYRALNSPLFSEEQNAFGLSQELDHIAASQNYSRGTLIATLVAKMIFVEFSSSSNGVNRESIKERFHEKLIAQVAENQFFSKVRGGVMEKKKRGFDEQLKWEGQVTQKVISLKQSSNRWSSVKTWDKERLFQPITVL